MVCSETKYENSSHDAKYLRAKERLTDIKKFYLKLIKSIIFIVFLSLINYYTNEWRHMWFLWAALGIGIGLVFKALKVFGVNPFLGRDWEERKINAFMKEEEQNQWN